MDPTSETFGFNDCFAHEQNRYLGRLNRSQMKQDAVYAKHMTEVAAPQRVHEVKEQQKQEKAIWEQHRRLENIVRESQR